MTTELVAHLPRLAYRMDEAAKISGSSQSTLFLHIQEGRLLRAFGLAAADLSMLANSVASSKSRRLSERWPRHAKPRRWVRRGSAKGRFLAGMTIET